MGFEKHVGRVGALAVALGIGAAVVSMPGVASAAPDTASARASASDSAQPSPAPKRVAGAPRQGGASPTTTRAERRAQRAAAAKDRPVANKGATASSKSTVTQQLASETTPQPAAEAKARLTARTGVPTASNNGDEQSVPVQSALKSPSLVTSLFARRTLAQGTATSNDAPSAPPGAPLAWTMLAATRRQLGDRPTNIADRTDTPPGTVTATTQVRADASSPQLPGGALQSPLIAADGTIYQVTNSVESGLRVYVLDHNAQVLHVADVSDGYTHSPAAVRPDGTLVVVSSNQRGNRSTLLQVDNQGVVSTLATFRGEQGVDEPMLVGADGSLYFRTSYPYGLLGGTIPFHYLRVSPTGAVRSLPYFTSAELDDQGRAYLVSRQLGPSTLRVVDTNGFTRTIPLPFLSNPSDPIVAQDGTVYVTAGVKLFGIKQTRLYTVTPTSTRIRTVRGLPGDTVVTPDGVYLETHTYPGSTDEGTGTTFISKITGTTIDTSDAIGGRIPAFGGYAETTGAFQVTSDGTALVPVNDASGTAGAVAIVHADGTVTTTAIPGTVVSVGRTIRVHGAGTQSADNQGYVSYNAGGSQYVAVVDADGTIGRTIALPEGFVGTTMFFGPNGTPYEVIDNDNSTVEIGSDDAQGVLVLSTGTYLPTLNASFLNSIEFGPDGTGYQVSSTFVDDASATAILGFNAAGATVVPPTILRSAAYDYNTDLYELYLSFAPDGTAYVTDIGVGQAGVYALTSSGAVNVVAFPNQRQRGKKPVFGADGTGYAVAQTDNDDLFGATVYTFSTL